MTGRIVALARNARTGIIRSLEGSRVTFSAVNVLGDFEALAVGHVVSFDLERYPPNHVAARVFREPSAADRPTHRSGASTDLRFAGFRQAGGIRSYCFDAIVPGARAQHFTVEVDMALLLKHHVGVQEVPALCLRKLAADLKGMPDLEHHELCDEELLAHTSSRLQAALLKKKVKHPFAGRRGVPPPAPSSRDRGS